MDRHGLICRSIWENPHITQREMAQRLSLSLGTVNHLIKECIALGYVKPDDEKSYLLTAEGRAFLGQFKVDGAVVLAAGFGSRFVPLTFESPKGLWEVFGGRMVERQIRQLHEAGVRDITVVVGYLKEKFEYLIDKYQVKLLYNPEYSCKNTLATVYHARDLFKGRNVYLLSSDNWLRENMYHAYECGSWYSLAHADGETSEWCVSFNKKGRITGAAVGGRDSWFMYGPVYFSREFSKDFFPVLERYYEMPGTEQFYWEHVLMEILNGECERRLSHAGVSLPDGWKEPEMFANCQPENQVYEFENLEELREFDPWYQSHSDNQAMELVSRVLKVNEAEIRNIKCLKAGMTNKSFLFDVGGDSYICRVPGPGTELLINRKQEAAVYRVVGGLGISERTVYFDENTGYKISKYYDGARNGDPHSQEDIAKCMELLRRFHQSGLKVDHAFDIWERTHFYENLCRQHGGIPFEDYSAVYGQMEMLINWLGSLNRPRTLSHIDSNFDNFLMLPDGQVRLIDWEYAGMCDPLIDLAMCAIYSYYNIEETENLMRTYLGREPEMEERLVVYAYMALGGFLWSLWAVYKAALGEEFGEYTLIMYRYAKDFSRIVQNNLQKS